MLLFTYELYCIILAVAVNVEAVNINGIKIDASVKSKKVECTELKQIITTKNCQCGSELRSEVYTRNTQSTYDLDTKITCTKFCGEYTDCQDDNGEEWQDDGDANDEGVEIPNAIQNDRIKAIRYPKSIYDNNGNSNLHLDTQKQTEQTNSGLSQENTSSKQSRIAIDFSNQELVSNHNIKGNSNLYSDIKSQAEEGDLNRQTGEEFSSVTANILSTFSSDNITDSFEKCDLIGGKSQCFKTYQLMSCYRKEQVQRKQKIFIEECNLESPYKEFKVSFESGKDLFPYKKTEQKKKSLVKNAQIERVVQSGKVSKLDFTGVLNLNRVLDFAEIEDDDEFYEICEVSQGKSKCFAALLLKRCFENSNVDGEWRTASKKCDFEKSPFKEFNEDFEKYKISQYVTETQFELFNGCAKSLCLQVIQRQSKAGISFDVEWYKSWFLNNRKIKDLVKYDENNPDFKTLENNFKEATGYFINNKVVSVDETSLRGTSKKAVEVGKRVDNLKLSTIKEENEEVGESQK